MEWNAQQIEALDRVGEWLRLRTQPFFYLAGFAGTGKTTLARHLTQGVKNTMFAAYTGKAAHVLTKKKCPATTIHRMIYQPRAKAIEKLLRLQEELKRLSPDSKEYRELAYKIKLEQQDLKKPSFTLNRDGPASLANLIVIDECSMVNEDMGYDLLSFNKPILVLGDPGQLPPVKGTGFFTNRRPDYTLTEIMRQAKENPIIQLSLDIREGRRMKLGRYVGVDQESGEEMVLDVRPMDMVTDDDELNSQQLLCGLNRTRRALNIKIRRQLGFNSPLPCKQDKLVCLRNDYNVNLLNGGQWRVVKDGIYRGGDKVQLDLHDIDSPEEKVECDAWSQYFDGDPDDIPYNRQLTAQEFDYGYAMTVHKSQGSQWDNVLLYDESHVFTSNRKEWLYTGITRAAKNLMIGV